MSERRVAICVTGWHYPEAFYRQLCSRKDVDVYVVSHRGRDEVSSWLTDLVPPHHIFFEPNLGYDWGCYQQFLDRGIWRQYRYLIFMHDDLLIHSMDFVEECIRRLEEGWYVIGNGLNSTKMDWPRTHLFTYGHSDWTPVSRDFMHQTVRGSFFAIKRETIEQMGKLEVFWDRFKLNIRFGNWSLIASCGKMQDLFGDRCFSFLGDVYRHSIYIDEHERGSEKESGRRNSLRFTLVYPFLRKISERYVAGVIENSESGRLRRLSRCIRFFSDQSTV